MLETVKLLLGIPDDDESKDKLLELIIAETVQRILNYCNLHELPKELELTAARMAAELFTESRIMEAISEPEEQVISSISEQGRTVSFSTTGVAEKIKAMTRAADEKISKKAELNKFKRLFRLPG